MALHLAFIGLTQPFLPDIYGKKITMKTFRNTMATVQHALSVTARRDADQDPLLAAEKSRDATALERLLQLIIHHFRHKQQSQFAQLGTPARIRGTSGLALLQRFGRCIYNDDPAGCA